MLSYSTRRLGRTVLAALTLLPVSTSAQPVRGVEVYAHRGARAFSPENTRPSFKTALRIGADWVDMDVVLTKESEVLVSHDPVLNPDITRDERGEFLAQSREALAKRPPAASTGSRFMPSISGASTNSRSSTSASKPPTSRRATTNRGERTASSPRTRRPPASGREASS